MTHGSYPGVGYQSGLIGPRQKIGINAWLLVTVGYETANPNHRVGSEKQGNRPTGPKPTK
jgi:hypothetical protein